MMWLVDYGGLKIMLIKVEKAVKCTGCMYVCMKAAWLYNGKRIKKGKKKFEKTLLK